MKLITTTLKEMPQIMINVLLDKILLYDDRIEIYYNYTGTENPDDNKDSRNFYFTAKRRRCLFRVPIILA
ncbi:MAG: hypothetical protein NC311_09880 [Muribaculaceae bacterium]|nr:hypothetical protein [Muribaculaceae bacterium]